MLIRNNFLFIIILAVVLSSCSDKITMEEEAGTRTSGAILEWHGDYASDGCGFFIIIDNETYKPENEEIIGTQFRKAGSMNVIVKYSEGNKIKYFQCGNNATEFSIRSIRIIWIKSS